MHMVDLTSKKKTKQHHINKNNMLLFWVWHKNNDIKFVT